MTLLLVIISITNIAIGYGLAIYLGHVRASRTPVLREARSQPEVEQPLIQEAEQDAPESATEAAVEPVAESSPPEPVEASVPEAVAEPEKKTAEATVAETTSDAPTEEQLLEKIEEVRSEIHDSPEPATMVEALAGETKPARPEPASEEPPAASKPVSKEALLESINVFQAQLKKQQELAKLHAVTPESQ